MILLLFSLVVLLQGSSRTLPLVAPPIPTEVLKKELELSRGLGADRMKSIRALAARIAPQAAASSDLQGLIKRSAASGFPGLPPAELNRHGFLLGVQTVRLLRLRYESARTPSRSLKYGPAKRPALSDDVKKVEAEQESIRNSRQQQTTAFQNFDQKSNQVLNMLTQVIKTMNEMRKIAVQKSGL